MLCLGYRVHPGVCCDVTTRKTNLPQRRQRLTAGGEPLSGRRILPLAGSSLRSHLDCARSEHHVQAQGADSGHVFLHNLVSVLRHHGNVLNLPFWIEAHPKKADAQLFTDRFGLVQVAVDLIASLVQVAERCPTELKLTSRLKRDALPTKLAPNNLSLL